MMLYPSPSSLSPASRPANFLKLMTAQGALAIINSMQAGHNTNDRWQEWPISSFQDWEFLVTAVLVRKCNTAESCPL